MTLLLRLTALAGCLLFAVPAARAQKNFHPGYIVQLAGDTVRGEVSVRGAATMAQTAQFRATKQAADRTYLPTELRAYGVTDGAAYHALPNPTVASAPAASPVFMLALAQGKASLYALPDDNDKLHYYYRMGTGSLTELVQREQKVRRDSTTVLERVYPFRAVLGRAMADCPAVNPLLVRAELLESQLVKIFNRYNTTCDPDHKAGQLKERRTTVGLVLLGGVQQGTMQFDAGTYTLNSSFRPVYGLGMVLHPVAFHPGVTVRLEALYQQQVYQTVIAGRTPFGLKRTTTADFQLTTLRVPLLFRYTLQSKGIRPYVQAGIETALQLDQQGAKLRVEEEKLGGGTTTQTDQIELRALGFGGTASVGLAIPTGQKGSVQLEARYGRLDGTSQVREALSGTQTLSFLLGYNFGH